eukprot:gnl/MRDRNA2_/MRDRNA2_179473_c0_seq1.p1 gnl/MRDRNA2_/MRDRNA2_179473_c0~~gnl/MRDRNA2_/MRDRNA2_179473_c0_seq1.p1  ORF type:complete len:187 (-),score=48.10 gnl/MRDRNA2_/MRDRNA2_179473_c0_seq1:142-702(-)
MVHVFDERTKQFIQVHPFKVDQRPSKDVRKRLRNSEYCKFLINMEKARLGMDLKPFCKEPKAQSEVAPKKEKEKSVEDSLHKQAEDRQMTSKFCKGEVVALQGQSGWVRPDIDFMMTIPFEIEQKLIKMNKDVRKKSNKPFGEDNVVFLRVSDVAQTSLVLKVGTMIQFKLYTFDEGVGACEIKKA